MADVGTRDGRLIDTLACPVRGDKVTVSATFKQTDSGRRSLVDFGCNREGRCLITSWDPCPLYTAYLEKSFAGKRV